MNTNDLAAFGTGPSLSFSANKIPYAELLDLLKIVHHTHAVLGSITTVQMAQPGAGVAFTSEAIPGFCLPRALAGLKATEDTSFRFETVIPSAAGTSLLLP